MSGQPKLAGLKPRTMPAPADADALLGGGGGIGVSNGGMHSLPPQKPAGLKGLQPLRGAAQPPLGGLSDDVGAAPVVGIDTDIELGSHGAGINNSGRVGGRGGTKLQLLDAIAEREELIQALRSVLVRWPTSKGDTSPRISPELLSSAPGVELTRALVNLREAGFNVTELVQDLESLLGSGKRDFMWTSPEAGMEVPYLAKMYNDLDFAVELMKGDAKDLFTTGDPLLLGPGFCHMLYDSLPPGMEHPEGSYAAAFGVPAESEDGITVVNLQMAHELISDAWRRSGMVDVAAAVAAAAQDNMASPKTGLAALRKGKGKGKGSGAKVRAINDSLSGAAGSPSASVLSDVSASGGERERSAGVGAGLGSLDRREKQAKARRAAAPPLGSPSPPGSGGGGIGGVGGVVSPGPPSSSASSRAGPDGRPITAAGSFRNRSQGSSTNGMGNLFDGEPGAGLGEGPPVRDLPQPRGGGKEKARKKHKRDKDKDKSRRKHKHKHKGKHRRDGSGDGGGGEGEGDEAERQRRRERRKRRKHKKGHRGSQVSVGALHGGSSRSLRAAVGDAGAGDGDGASDGDSYDDDDFESDNSSDSDFGSEASGDGGGGGGGGGSAAAAIYGTAVTDNVVALAEALARVAGGGGGGVSSDGALWAAMGAMWRWGASGGQLAALRDGMRGLGLTRGVAEVQPVAAALLVCLDTAVGASAAAAVALAGRLVADPAHDVRVTSWREGAGMPQVQAAVAEGMAAFEAALSAKGRGDGDDGSGGSRGGRASVVCAVIAAALAGLRAANAVSRTLPASTFHSAGVNTAVRALMHASWAGDQLPLALPSGSGHGGSKGGQGIAPWVAPAFMAAVCLPIATPGADSYCLLDGHTKAAMLASKLAHTVAGGDAGAGVGAAGAGGGGDSGDAGGASTVERLSVTVGRDSAFEDLFAAVDKAGAVPAEATVAADGGAVAPARGSARLLAPQFFSDFVGDLGPVHGAAKGDDGGEDDDARSVVGVEEGEGHGPRKELFSLATRQVCREWSADMHAPPHVRLAGHEGIPTLHGPGLGTIVKVGFRITLAFKHDSDGGAGAGEGGGGGGMPEASRDGEGEDHHFEVVSIAGTDEVSVNTMLPGNVADAPFRFSLPLMPLLVYRQGAEAYWPNPFVASKSDIAARYRFVGWLMGAALVNRCDLDVRVPRLFFSMLLDESLALAAAAATAEDASASADGWDAFEANLPDLRDLDAELYTTAALMRELDDAAFKGVVEAEGLPATTTREAYVKRMVEGLVVEGVRWQVSAMRAGFGAALGSSGLRTLREARVSADDLAEMLCGPGAADGAVGVAARAADFSVRDLFLVAYDKDMRGSAAMQEALWRAVDAWAPQRKRALLRFVTGVARLPAPTSSVLRVEMPFMTFSLDDKRAALARLPQAHTCTNSLELPDYWGALRALKAAGEDVGLDVAASGGDEDVAMRARLTAIIDDRLGMAVDNCAGYGLDSIAMPEGEGLSELRSTLKAAMAQSPLLRDASHGGALAGSATLGAPGGGNPALYATTGGVSMDDLPTLGGTMGGSGSLGRTAGSSRSVLDLMTDPAPGGEAAVASAGGATGLGQQGHGRRLSVAEEVEG